MIIRKSKRRKFTSLSNQLLQDHSLSFATRGLLAYLLSKPDDWECRITDIEREGNIGTTARRTMMIEAEKAGYLTFERTRNERGQFFSAYTVFEEPVAESERTFSWKSNEKPDLDEPATENPPPENPPPDGIGDIVKTEVQNTDLQKTEREREPLSLAEDSADTSNLFDTIKQVTGFQPVDLDGERKLWTVAEKLRGGNITSADLTAYASTRTKSAPKLQFLYDDICQWKNTRQSVSANSPSSIAPLQIPPGLSPGETKRFIEAHVAQQRAA